MRSQQEGWITHGMFQETDIISLSIPKSSHPAFSRLYLFPMSSLRAGDRTPLQLQSVCRKSRSLPEHVLWLISVSHMSGFPLALFIKKSCHVNLVSGRQREFIYRATAMFLVHNAFTWKVWYKGKTVIVLHDEHGWGVIGDWLPCMKRGNMRLWNLCAVALLMTELLQRHRNEYITGFVKFLKSRF